MKAHTLRGRRNAGLIAILSVLAVSCHGLDLSGGTFQVPALPPDSFTPVASLTSRNPTLQTPFLSQPKHGLTATTLRTGLVALVGGTTGGTACQETEIYDQRSAEFSVSSLMGEARRYHTATLTSAGDIVVIGGVGQGSSPLISAEIWNAGTGTYSVVSQMAAPRVGHSATSLPGGQILVVGGFTDSTGSHLTDSVEALDLPTGRWIECTPIQATSASANGFPRALHTATAIAGPNGIPGDGDDVILVAGGVMGDPASGVVTSVSGSVLVYYPGDSTQLPTGPPLPGKWKSMRVTGMTSEVARLGHAAHIIGTEIDATTKAPIGQQLLIIGGLAGAVPLSFGPFTATYAGASLVEDSPGATSTLAVLDIDIRSLGAATGPEGDISQAMPIATPPAFVGGIGARSVLSPMRDAALYAGGNTLCTPPPYRCEYNRNAYVIEWTRDPSTQYATIQAPMLSSGQMGDIRSFFAATILPGADGHLRTADDTILVAGGQQSPVGQASTADEYTFP